MGWWSNLFGVTPTEPNSNGPIDYQPGDADGVQIDIPASESRALNIPAPVPWSGWPGDWSTSWNTTADMNRLIDTAWACIDLNSSILAAMPVYRMASGQITAPCSWMSNPDPDVYTSWQEFAKQLFWDYQLTGEAFVLPMATGADGYPLRFRVVPPWLVNVEMRGGQRQYLLGSADVTGEILHIRYQSSTTDAHGHGPLEAVGARITAAGMLQRYANKIAETGGTPMYWMEVDRRLNQAEAEDLLDRWVESRTRRAGEPALVSGGAKLSQANSMSARDMTLLELSQFNESRIAVALGVPPYLVGLPAGGDSLTYSNVSQLFDFHDRSSLRPKASAVMAAVSGWALPRGQFAELNRDEYTRPTLKERAEAYQILIGAGVMSADEARAMERLQGPAPTPTTPTTTGPNGSPDAALSLTGGNHQ